ncbi:polyhomeotic-proximal chromatin -like, partial [Olea europaea subsp. europaea]
NYGYIAVGSSDDDTGDSDSENQNEISPAKHSSPVKIAASSKVKADIRKERRKEDRVSSEVKRNKNRRKKYYVEKVDRDFVPGSKDFKVDINLERQARKRKEKKIFDPSNYEQKTRRTNSRKETQDSHHSAGSSSSSSRHKMISPPKKVAYVYKRHLTSPTVVPPGRAPQITPLVPMSVCYICESYGKRVKGVPEKLLSCVNCSIHKVHLSCLNEGKPAGEKLVPYGPNTWSCKFCRKCAYCKQMKKKILLRPFFGRTISMVVVAADGPLLSAGSVRIVVTALGWNP